MKMALIQEGMKHNPGGMLRTLEVVYWVRNMALPDFDEAVYRSKQASVLKQATAAVSRGTQLNEPPKETPKVVDGAQTPQPEP